MEITSKRRAELKKIGNKFKAIVRVGKDGVSENLIESINGAIKNRELIKVKILDNLDEDKRDVANKIAEGTGSKVIEIRGSVILIFKENPKKPRISEKLRLI
ncbi:MAG: YhbY family RNA-binding protein [Fusobacteriota bacterium]